MPTASRQPLNYAAPDLQATLDAEPFPLREMIDHWRGEVHRTGARLDEAKRLAGLKFHPHGVRVETPEAAGARHRVARATLHFLLQLDLLQKPTTENV